MSQLFNINNLDQQTAFRDDILKDFEALGRWVPRNLGMFVSMKHVFQVGMVNERIIEGYEDDEDEDEEPEAQ